MKSIVAIVVGIAIFIVGGLTGGALSWWLTIPPPPIVIPSPQPIKPPATSMTPDAAKGGEQNKTQGELLACQARLKLTENTKKAQDALSEAVHNRVVVGGSRIGELKQKVQRAEETQRQFEGHIKELNEPGKPLDEKIKEWNQILKDMPNGGVAGPIAADLPDQVGKEQAADPATAALLQAAAVGLCVWQPALCPAIGVLLGSILQGDTINKGDVEVASSLITVAQGGSLSDAEMAELGKRLAKATGGNFNDVQSVQKALQSGNAPEILKQNLITKFEGSLGQKERMILNLLRGENLDCDQVRQVYAPGMRFHTQADKDALLLVGKQLPYSARQQLEMCIVNMPVDVGPT